MTFYFYPGFPLWPETFSCTANIQLVQTINNQQYADLTCPFYLSASSLILFKMVKEFPGFSLRDSLSVLYFTISLLHEAVYSVKHAM